MILIADEGVDRQIVERLRTDGHDVSYVAELDPGLSDEAVLAQGQRAASLLITPDKDFGELVFRQGRTSAGVLLLRLAGLAPGTKASVVSIAIRDHGEEFSGVFSVLTPGGIRIRRSLTP